MNKRLFIPVFLVFVCASLMAQPEIVSITYSDNEAILTRNTPPAGIIYYWQGSSCGTLMNHSGSTTVSTTSGTFYLREYYSSSMSWATSCASTIVIMPDVTPPVLTDVTTGPIDEGDNIAATSNEDGMIFLVPAGTAANYSAIVASRVASESASANVAVALLTTGLSLGDYQVYAADDAHNISTASAITIADLTAPVLSDVTAGPIEAGSDILATSNEDGMIYLVPDGTAPNLGDISSGQVAQIAAVASVASILETTGISVGDYVVYAIDGSDNISAASPLITVTSATSIDLNVAGADQVQLYPSTVRDILYIKSEVRVSSVLVYSLQGAKVISITTAADKIYMSSLADGVYIVKVQLVDNTIYSGKITKQ